MADDRITGTPPLPPGRTPSSTGSEEPSPAMPASSPTKPLLVDIFKSVVRMTTPQGTHIHSAGNIREMVETVVFVVVLVLLLKTFAAEAFVIPTGSMATTLWGYQKVVICPMCGHRFPVNCSEQVERSGPPVLGCNCPNCRYNIDFSIDYDPSCNSGDRVLVFKALYDTFFGGPHRLDVVVFKYPKGPQQNQTPMNYIKRLIGLPGETIGIYYGKLYVKKPGAETDRHDENFLQQEHLKVAAGSTFDDFDNEVDLLKKYHVPASVAKISVKSTGTAPSFRFVGDEGSPPKMSIPDGTTQAFHRFDLTINKLEIDNSQEGNAPAEVDVEFTIGKEDLWERGFMHADEASNELKGGDPRFEILRKPPDKILAMMRGVYDNDEPASDLPEPAYQRWLSSAENDGWKPDETNGFRHDSHDGRIGWLRYRHILRPTEEGPATPKPELITDIVGYNSRTSMERSHPLPPQNWVGDLILESEVTIDQPQGTLVLELSKGIDRFQARWELATGNCTLVRLHDQKEETLDTQPTALKKKGTYRIRFANVDERLTVWVDGDFPFGGSEKGKNYSPPSSRGPQKNDLEPASIGVQGIGVSVRHLKLWRDTYYTQVPGEADVAGNGPDILSDPDKWEKLRNLPARTLYVQPQHYLCLGDNSPESSDGRSWGLVPERLLLGRALFVYYPFKAPLWPFNSPVNRMGAIH